MKTEGERAAQTQVEKANELKDLTVKIQTEREKLQQSQNDWQATMQQVAAARQNLQTLEHSLAEIRDEANALRARRETLENLDKQNALLIPAVQKLFAAQEKIGVKLSGTLADFLEVESEHEKAVEAVFETFLQAVVVENKADVEKISAWLKTTKTGTINLLVASVGEKTEKKDNDRETIADYLNISAGLRDVLQRVLPMRMDLRVVEDLTQAAEHIEENCVTLGGEIVRQNCLFSFGQANSNEKGILSFKRELRELAVRSVNLKHEFDTAETKVKTAREVLVTAEKEVADINSKIVGLERELMSHELGAKAVEQEIERAERHGRVVEDESQRLDEERADLAAKHQKTETDRLTAESELKIANADLDKISSNLVEAREQVESANQSLSEQRAAAAAAGERRRALQNALRRIEQEHAELAARLENRRQDSLVATARLDQLGKALAELEIQTTEFANEKTRETETLVFATNKLTVARAFADQSAVELEVANADAARAKDARAALEISHAETAVKLQNLSENCQHELNQSLANLPTVADDFDLPEGKRRAVDLREKIESFGAVNLLALEELNEAEERLLFLTSQRRDIVDGIAAAEDALDEIKRRSRERFENAFHAINRNFTQIFAEIFGGGTGEMSLLDASDVLESGVEIVAQPPGKRLQNLLLLSGGEKALTAIALVLAIFRFRPAPFCLLDEVDAPLDEANVGRFVKKVREMSENIQFIVITHNKRTMEAARALYGVTMEEAGVSKIVSVKFE